MKFSSGLFFYFYFFFLVLDTSALSFCLFLFGSFLDGIKFKLKHDVKNDFEKCDSFIMDLNPDIWNFKECEDHIKDEVKSHHRRTGSLRHDYKD